MGEVIATFADGRLLVQESKACESRYVGSGIPFRIGGISQVEKVLSVDNDYSPYGLISPLSEVRIGRPLSGRGVYSGQVQELSDYLMVVLRRGDLGLAISGDINSGRVPQNLMSGITSGLAWMGEVLSGNVKVSGAVTITANVIGY
jgi:hypothetical protein